MIQTKRKLTIAAASQNLDTINEKVIHRLIPMLVAENITKIDEYISGKSIPRVDMWNCVGMKMDQVFKGQDAILSRRNFSNALLADKYALLNELGIQRVGRDVIRDDDESTQAWVSQELHKLLTSGRIYINSTTVNICNRCGYLQSVDGTSVASCTLCKSNQFHKEKRNLLMVDIPDDRQSLIEKRIIYPHSINHIRSFFDQLPSRMMISKVREYGLSLDSIGLEDYVLDPKIGIVLMTKLVAERYELSELTLTQGANVATNSIPYTSLLTNDIHHSYVLLPKIPATTLDEARAMGISFVAKYLPIIMMTYNDNITERQLRTAHAEYLRIARKRKGLLFKLRSENSGSKQGVLIRSDDNQLLSEIFSDISQYKVRDGREKLRRFFKNQGRRYSQEMMGKGYYLSPTDIHTLENITKLFYI